MVFVAARSCAGPVIYVELTEACALFYRKNTCRHYDIGGLDSTAGHDAHRASDSVG